MGGSTGESSYGPRSNENPGHSSSESRVRNPDGLKSKGSSALPISRGLVDPKSYRNSNRTKGQLVNIPVLPPLKVDTLGNIEPDSRPVEPEKLVEAVMARSELIPG